MRGHAHRLKGPITPVSMVTTAWLPCRRKSQVSLGDQSGVCVCALSRGVHVFVCASFACSTHAGLHFSPEEPDIRWVWSVPTPQDIKCSFNPYIVIKACSLAATTRQGGSQTPSTVRVDWSGLVTKLIFIFDLIKTK